MLDSPAHKLFYSSLVVEHIVPKGGGRAFQKWHASLIRAAKHHAGFVRADCCPPLNCADGMIKWYSILHFDSKAHLNDWVNSEQRKILLANGQELFRDYRFKSFTTGLEGWFSHQTGLEKKGLGPPPWKQILTVVLGLYPLVMTQSIIVKALDLMQNWPPAIAMLINNLITSTILSLLVMPFLSKRLGFWLQPAYRHLSSKINLTGILIVFSALSLMVVLFNWQLHS